MVDVARLGLAVDSSQVEKGTVSLHQLTGAAGQASAAAQRLAGASQTEAAGQKAATVAVQAHNAALMAQNAVMRSSMQQRTMMIYQLNDVAVSLASGMNPAMVAMQQGSQILQGGLMPAVRTLSDLVGGLIVKFAPLGAAVGAVSLLLYGFTRQINEANDANVSMVDTALAMWESLASAVQTTLGPAFAWLSNEVNRAVDQITKDTAREINTIIGLWVGSVDAIKAVWGQIPDAIGYVVYEASRNVTNAVVQMVSSVMESINDLFSRLDTVAVGFGGQAFLPRLDINEYQRNNYKLDANPYGSAEGAVGAAGDAFSAAMGRDYVGDWMNGIGQRAQEIALARQETEELGGAAKAANDNFKSLNDTAKSLADTWSGVLKSAWGSFWQDFQSGLKEGKSAWEALGGAAMNALEQLTSKALEMAANGIWNLLFGALGPTLGFGSWGIGSGMAGTSSITGSSGGYFPAFDGGGYTGSGSRSGGLDGKGGFLAMMHPNETVLDHSRGQGGGVSVVRIELGPDLEGRVLTQAAGQSVQIVRASQPDTVQKATAASGKALAGGDYRRGMATYGLQQQAKRR